MLHCKPWSSRAQESSPELSRQTSHLLQMQIPTPSPTHGNMCGIHAVISLSQPGEIATDLRRCLCNRGPDHITTHETRLANGVADGAPETHLAFTSSVLALRGGHIAQQPFIDPVSGSVFCWNGEAWKIRHHDVFGNDGEAIAALLNEAVKLDLEEREAAVLRVLRSIDGPFAFVFFDKFSGKVYYGRDRLGRRSMVIREGGQCVVLSSITDAADPQWREVEADGIYVVDVASIHSQDKTYATTRLEWLDDDGAADFVSVLLQLAQVLHRDASKYLGLTYTGFQYWTVQLKCPIRGDLLGLQLARGEDAAAAVDGIPQNARSGCAFATRSR